MTFRVSLFGSSSRGACQDEEDDDEGCDDDDIEWEKKKWEYNDLSSSTVESPPSFEEAYAKSDHEEYTVTVEEIDNDIVWGVDRHIRWEVGIDTIRSMRGKSLDDTIWTCTYEETDWMFDSEFHRLDHEDTTALEGEEFGMRNQGDEKNAKNNY